MSFLGIGEVSWIYIEFPCSKCLIYDLSNAPETTEICRRDCHCRFLLAVSCPFTFAVGHAFSQIAGVCVCFHQLKNLQTQVNSTCSPVVSRRNSLFISLSLLCLEYGVEILSQQRCNSVNPHGADQLYGSPNKLCFTTIFTSLNALLHKCGLACRRTQADSHPVSSGSSAPWTCCFWFWLSLPALGQMCSCLCSRWIYMPIWELT